MATSAVLCIILGENDSAKVTLPLGIPSSVEELQTVLASLHGHPARMRSIQSHLWTLIFPHLLILRQHHPSEVRHGQTPFLCRSLSMMLRSNSSVPIVTFKVMVPSSVLIQE
ncbi:hypothetical protein KUCAC02_005953 [Chaenocephalus aceratus]|uniref:Uncharacterized protein n=1 Tax=Chaenocephalus aceratus TaxID=36190 RepID=A0ACB9WQU2_CHAAC|nr:hypothetical protein KUCAC02_005953 [Chaenocephalus aceratus]